MTCPPDCLACHAARLMPAELSALLHKELGHWRKNQVIPAGVAVSVAALMWLQGTIYGRSEEARFRDSIERVRT